MTIRVKPDTCVTKVAAKLKESFDRHPKAEDPQFIAELHLCLAYNVNPMHEMPRALHKSDAARFLEELQRAMPEVCKDLPLVWKGLMWHVFTRLDQ